MRADSADRIFAAPPLETLQPRVSIPRIFALALVLPFAHLHRLILGGLIPAALIAGFLLSPPGRGAIDWLYFLAEIYSDRWAPGPLPSATALWLAWAVLFLALMLWLCAWQRGAAGGFGEPVGRWLFRSLLQLPGYVVALILWLVAPIIVTLPGSFVIGWALQRSIEKAQNGMPSGLGLQGSMLTPVQWWVAGIGTLTFTLLGLWVSARLSPLPALVSSQGWRGALGNTWRASSGHGFGLSVSLLAYSVIGFVLMFLISTILLLALASPVALTGTDYVDVTRLSMRITSIVSLSIAGVVLFWGTAIAALLVRERADLVGPLDLTTFD